MWIKIIIIDNEAELISDRQVTCIKCHLGLLLHIYHKIESNN